MRGDDLLTTHRLEEAEWLCHRVAILSTTFAADRLRDYRPNRFVVGTTTVLPLLFIIPLIQVFHSYAHMHSSNLNLHARASML
jgi:hypothetical protein